MNLTITARHFKLKDDMRVYVEEKCEKLEKYFDSILGVEAILGWEKQDRYSELKINVNGKQIVVKETSEDLRKSFDLSISKAKEQLKRHKEKLTTSHRTSA